MATLGYDVDRSERTPKLVVNPEEATKVRRIFSLYLELKNLKWRGGTFQAEGPLDRANFRIKYRYVKARRNLTLYTGNSSSYTRDEYSRHVEDWLLLRRFVMKTGARAAKGVNTDDQAVASY